MKLSQRLTFRPPRLAGNICFRIWNVNSQMTRSISEAESGSASAPLAIKQPSGRNPMKRIRIIGSQQNGPEYLYEDLDFVAQGEVKRSSRLTHWQRPPRPMNVLRRARPGSALSSKCNRRSEQSPPVGWINGPLAAVQIAMIAGLP